MERAFGHFFHALRRPPQAMRYIPVRVGCEGRLGTASVSPLEEMSRHDVRDVHNGAEGLVTGGIKQYYSRNRARL